MIFIAALAAIALSLALAGRSPVQAVDTKVNINQQLPISSDGFKEEDDCGDITSGVVWHFILNNYAPDDAQLFVTFDDAGAMGPIAETPHPSTTHHFYVSTPDDDILTDAYVMLPGDAGDAQLVLSHVCHTGEEQSVEESASEAESVAESASGEQSVEAGTGTPEESAPDGALFGVGSSPLPTIAFSLILLASLGGLAYANVKTVRSRI
jgi:hypothetical protein